MATGSAIARVCICDDFAQDALELHIPPLLCPAPPLWPATRNRVEVGGALFPDWAANRAISELRAFAWDAGWVNADKLGTHSLRREAARAILAARDSSSQLLRSGKWRSSAYKLYLDMVCEESGAMASAMAEESDDD